MAKSAIGSVYPLIKNGKDKAIISWRFRPIVHAEYGYVFDAGDKTALQINEHNSFARLGAKLKTEFWSSLPALERFKLTIEGSHYETLSGKIGSGSLFSTELNYRLDEKGNMSLKAEYEKGNIPLAQDKVEILTVGLGVKF